MKITKKIKKQIDKHAKAVFPNECVGVIVDRDYHPLNNISDNPENHFHVDIAEYAEVTKDGTVRALIHSHTFDSPVDRRAAKRTIDRRTPSKSDMATQQAMNVPFGIIHTDGKAISDVLWFGENTTPELLEREFIHGVTDCYSIVRDYFKLERDIELPDYPREWAWWESDENMYLDLFEKTGFEEIDESDLQVGDVVLMSVLAESVNHAGVYVDNNKMLHHLVGRLSIIEPYNQWMKYKNKIVRYME